MINRIGRYTLQLTNKPVIIGYGAVAGKKEAEGPLGKGFDKIFYDTLAGCDTWEQAESKFQQEAVEFALEKAGCKARDIDVALAGDLLNQCISSSYGLRDYNIPFLGQYGACSTMAQTLLVSSLLVEGGCASRALAVTSSHFCSAERQFRFPLEYGGQRTPTSQWTVTGAGAAIVSKNGAGAVIHHVTIGKITDLGITDINNMGAAMSPAAADTIKNFLNDTNTKPSDYDIIVTGDLGKVGSELLYEILEKDNINIRNNHKDCGLLIYDLEEQDAHAGGSGCGCSGSVLCSYILNNINSGNLKNILFIATGALMSPTSTEQGQSIPGIAHLLNIKWK
ncbi:MAG TPA: stage V sporulation protein AD [Clostridiales bacterium]|nr:stage V sporulation protein AD [Clostridiales bacterium]